MIVNVSINNNIIINTTNTILIKLIKAIQLSQFMTKIV